MTKMTEHLNHHKSDLVNKPVVGKKPHSINFDLSIITDPRIALPITRGRPLAEIEDEMMAKMNEYAFKEIADNPMIFHVTPGSRKTSSGVEIAQQLALAGKQVVWVSPRRNSFEDIQGFPHFKSDLWYEWLTIHDTNRKTGKPICKNAETQLEWTNQGYPIRGLCSQICKDYKKECPYLNQSKNVMGRNVFGRHQHLVSGLNLSEIYLLIVDENPLDAIVAEIRVAPERLTIPTAPLMVQNLASYFQELTKTAQGTETNRIAGLDLIEPMYDRFSSLVEDYKLSKSNHRHYVQFPEYDQNATLPYAWIDDTLDILIREFKEFHGGAVRWAERIWVSADGLHLLKKRSIHPQMPSRCIILDSTAEPEIIAKIWGKIPEVYSERVERKGQVFQYVQRTNGKSRMVDVDKPDNATEDTWTMIKDVKKLIQMYEYQRPGIICHAQTKDLWQTEFPEAKILNFGGLRGSNFMMRCDGTFVAGINMISPGKLIDVATALDENRMSPFGQIDENGELDLGWTHKYRQYPLSETGLQKLRQLYGEKAHGAKRMIGCYGDSYLDAISHQFGESELVHGIHRPRLIRRLCDLWLMTAHPTSEPVDWLFQSFDIRPINMSIEHWELIQEDLKMCIENGYSISKEFLAFKCKVSIGSVGTLHWLDSIARLFPEDWKIDWERTDSGQKQKVLIPVRTADNGKV
jgi:hypothetical protein